MGTYIAYAAGTSICWYAFCIGRGTLRIIFSKRRYQLFRYRVGELYNIGNPFHLRDG